MHLERLCSAVLATPSRRKGLGSPCLTNMEFSSLPKEHPARLLLSQARSCPSIRLSSHRRAPPLIVDSSLPKQPPLLYSLPRKNVPPASKNVPLQVPPLQPPLDAGHLPRPPRGADRLPRRQGRRICHPCTCSSPGQKKKKKKGMLITPQFLEDPDTRAPLARLGKGRILTDVSGFRSGVR